MKPFQFLLLTVVFLGGCTGLAMVSDTKDAPTAAPLKNERQTRVEAGKHKEVCFQSSEGDSVFYRFEAAAPLDFNLHYHIDDEVYYPVPQHVTAAEKGQYVVPADDTYCLMWANSGSSAVALSVLIEGVRDLQWY